ncbi:hypothetical protein [Asanoa ishikariensis]|uniref:hypothetical protein n=1 Tax=Asanoa ishikariensis TaxID=137265 RepID=UPI000B883C68|nr:hypothetical protein [Asanoa ishikariensis]
MDKATTRRRLLRAGAAAGAGAVAAGVVAVDPAHAAPGDAVLLGLENDGGASGTTLTGGDKLNGALAVASKVRVVPTPLDRIPLDAPIGTLATTADGDVMVAGPNGPAWLHTDRWSNVTSAMRPIRVLDTRKHFGVVLSGEEYIDGNGRVAGGRTIVVRLDDYVGDLYSQRTISVYINLTVTRTVQRGYVTTHNPLKPRPATSSLNYSGPNQTIANLVEVTVNMLPQSTQSAFALFVSSPAAIIADVCGLTTRWPMGR